MKSIKRLTAGLLILILLLGVIPSIDAEAAIKKPGNCRFLQWRNPSFTACRIAWNKTAGLTDDDYYEIKWTYTTGENYNHRYQYSKYNVLDITGLSPAHMYRAQVRVVKTNGIYVTGYSKWSDYAFLVPLPRTINGELVNGKKHYIQLRWNEIAGAAGYSIWLSTSPGGKWHHYRNTSDNAGAVSAVIKKYRGHRLKTCSNYYVRIIPRCRQSGVYRPVPVPSGYEGYCWQYRFSF
ncbi:MAG: fibronectin type III domain-containing protein [Eubacteriales bacterium]|nr:fibronectin type III domain-containing protein [Eubacteriales bacterium]